MTDGGRPQWNPPERGLLRRIPRGGQMTGGRGEDEKRKICLQRDHEGL
jgi:hypothetical protein